MKIEIKLYRLSSFNKEILDILNYNFFSYEDSNMPFFWRNLIKFDRDVYMKFYDKELKRYIQLLSNTENFYLSEPIDITNYVSGYSLNLTLKNLKTTQTIEFKEDFSFEIKENDLIVIKENDKIVFIGFIIYKTVTETYGEFRIQSAVIANIGYLYQITNIAVNWALAKYAVSGQDVKEIYLPLFQNIFNNKNIFQILEEIYTGANTPNEQGYFYATQREIIKKENNVTYPVKQFVFDFEKFKKLKSFNTIFVMLKTLQLYIEQYEKEFIWAEIEHSEHRVYNTLIANSIQLFVPSFQTIDDIIDDIVKNAFYDYFIDLDGKLVCRPPLYNYLPFDILEEKEDRFEFKKQHDFYISKDEIFSEEFEYNNSNLKTRTDTRWLYPFIGEIEWVPSFYIDIKALLKYGFRADAPFTNPNAVTAKLATLLAAITNIIQNSITRTLTIKVKFDPLEPDSMFKYKIGRLYYLEKYNMVGYLISITRKMFYGDYPYFELVFIYLRDVEYVKPNYVNLIDLISIYNRYGIFEKITDRTIDIFTFKKIYNEMVLDFSNKIKNKKIPAFKVFPSILDFIELTYTDTQIQSAVKQINIPKQIDETDIMVGTVNNNLVIRDFKIKLQKYFEYEKIGIGKNEYNIEFKNPKNNYNLSKPYKFFMPKNIKPLYEYYNNLITKYGNYKKYKDEKYLLLKGVLNLEIWQTETQFKLDDFGYITQNLFNRIMLCNMRLREKCDILPPYTKDNYIYSYIKDNYSIVKRENDFFKIVNTNINKYNYHSYNLYKPVKEEQFGMYIIDPQTFFNFDFLCMNVLTNYEKYENMIDVSEKQRINLFKAHKEGRAIDVILPVENIPNLLYPHDNFLVIKNNKVLNWIIYKKAFIEYMEKIFKIYFDKVEKNQVEIWLFKDRTDLEPVLKLYWIYHLEVINDNYLNIMQEL